MKKLGLWVLSMGLLAGVAGCSQEKEEAVDASGVTFRVKSAPAEKMTFLRRLRIHMNAEPILHADICAKIPGVIEIFSVKKGDTVKGGNLLFQTDKFQLEANLDIARQELRVLEASHRQAELRIDVAKEQLKKAQIDSNRNQTLMEKQAISVDRFEQFKLTLVEAENSLKLAVAACDYAKIKVEQAENNIRIAERRYNDSIMRAPFDAMVVETFYEEWEHAESAKKVLRLESRNLELTALIPAGYYRFIQTGKTTAQISCPNSGYQAKLPITYKGVYVDPISRTFEIKIQLPEGANVLSGMLCEADIILGEDDGYGLPDTAFIAQTGGKFAVFSCDNGTAKKHVVDPAIMDNGRMLLQLNDTNIAGMNFVIEGQAFLDDGVKVEEVQ